MKRRRFLESVAVGGSLPLVTGGIPVARSLTRPTDQPLTVRRGELDELTIADLQAAMASGRWTATDLVGFYTQRLNLLDRPRGGIHAVIERNPDAVAAARDSDNERRAGRVRGPLHGIPILIKDNIDTGDRMMTTAGALALVGPSATRDAFIVRRLRAAGAVLLGKTNLSEWANFRSNWSSSGWSGRGGQTRNPYVLDRNPCGSSSGSGAAVAANMCAVAVGTETDGSIVCPASANGVVGLKPTVGLVSRAGIIPISATQDTAGPMARTVTDAAILLGALAGPDPDDTVTGESEPHVATDYTRLLSADGLRGKRIGILRSEFGFHERVDMIMEAAIVSLRSVGAVIVDPVSINAPRGSGGWEHELLEIEFKDGVNRYLAGRGAGAPVRSLGDVIAFNEAHRATSMPFFGQETLISANARGGVASDEYRTLRQKSLGGARQAIDATLAHDQLDAIMAPTGGPAWTTDLINGDHFGGGSSGHAARAGYPNITVPAGFVAGLPVGVSFFSTAWHESELLGMAFAFELATRARRPPGFLPSLIADGP